MAPPPPPRLREGFSAWGVGGVLQELLPRRVRVAKMAIHSRIIKLHKVDDAGGVWALMDALQVLDDLLKMQ